MAVMKNRYRKRIFFLCSFLLWMVCSFAQTSDDQFKMPLKDVLAEIQQRYKVAIRYPDALVADRWVTFAEWRFRPDVEKTMSDVLASQDISFAKEGEKKYKLQA